MANKQDNKKSNVMGVPPHDIVVEKSVLGAVLIDKDAVVKVVEFLRPKHFYLPAHQYIFEAVLELYEKREPADLITVPSNLKKKKRLKDVGGVSYLTDLVNTVPTAANVEHYAKIIRDDYVKRTLITVSGDIGSLVQQEPDVEQLLDKAELKRQEKLGKKRSKAPQKEKAKTPSSTKKRNTVLRTP